MRLEALFRPKSIAVIGASDKPTIGRRLIASLERIGFSGPIFPINPNYSTVLGRKCYASVAELPEAPHVAAFCVGHERVLDGLLAAAERGVQGAVIYDGGFAERGADGISLQTQIERICRDAGIALCGPNCMGVLSPHDCSTTYLQELRDPAGLAGNVGIVSQSGAFCISLLTDIRRFGFSHVASSGNEAVLVAADYLEYLVDDPHTKVIGCFIETVRYPDRFIAALDRAADEGKPVVVLKVGRTERTQRAVTTHTGGLAGDPRFVSEFLRTHRAIEVSDLVEFTEVIAASQGEKRPAGRRIGVITSSGGLAELILDIAASEDLRLPPLSVAAKAEIERQIGFVTGDGNPLDAWGNGTFATNLPHALAVLDGSPDHDIVVFCRDNNDDQPFEMPELPRTYLDLFVRAAASSSKPHYLLHTRPGVMNQAQVAHLRAAGISVVGGIREGLAAIDRLARHAPPAVTDRGEQVLANPVVLYDVDEKVSVITLNRPEKLNAISAELQQQLLDAFIRADADAATSVVLLRAEGRSFCAGYDISAKEPTKDDWRSDPTNAHEHLRVQLDFEMVPWTMRKPVIASVQGHVMGGGCEVVMLCDLTIAADNASFGEPEVRFSSVGPAIVMPMIIGYKKARELLYFGDTIDAKTALELGMINRIVPLAELREVSLRYAKRLSLISPEALYATKRAINRGADAAGFRTAIYAGLDVVGPLYATKTEFGARFREIVASEGVPAAVKWRAAQFKE